ncbi:hypothetical protein CK203_002995 [Vitis vinifera]|uniref:Uncharacterized protein n=1 Tax=Vitis vinifera TaxID=29760 RepID=A0A438K770_VITVI|nr:hypothetical protein CK203_002995 [Vitis vinifera]
MCVGTEEATTSRIRASLVRIFSTLRTRIKIQEENKNYPSSSLDAPSHTVDHNYPLRQTAVLHRIHYANAPSLLGLILFSEDKNCMEEASTMKANYPLRQLIVSSLFSSSLVFQLILFSVIPSSNGLCEPILDVATRLWDCTAKRVVYIRDLEENLNSLESLTEELSNLSKDVMVSVEREEELQQSRRTHEVDGWLRAVEVMEAEVKEILQNGRQESNRNVSEPVLRIAGQATGWGRL